MLDRLEQLAREAADEAAQRQLRAYDGITENRIEWPGTAVKEHEAAEDALRRALAELERP